MNFIKIFTAILSILLVPLLFNFSAGASETNQEPNLLLAKIHGDTGLPCTYCHDGYNENGGRMVDSSKSSDKLSSEDGDEFCLTCHEIDDIDKQVVFKYNGDDVHPHSQHVGDIPCSDCHSMHSKSRLMCADCHIQPWMKTLPKSWELPE